MRSAVPLDAVDCRLVALHLDEGEAVLRVAVAFDHQGTDFPVLFEVAGQFGLQVTEVSLPAGPRTLPSRLVMNNLVGLVSGERDRPLFDYLDELRELMINLI